jgi:fatty-acyl-CoA synthase
MPKAHVLNTGELLDRNAIAAVTDRIRRSSHLTAVVTLHEEEYSYAELGRRIGATAELLRARGVQRGDRVAFAAGNSSEVLEFMAATLALGAAFVPLNTRLSGAELAFIIGDAGAHLVVADAALATLVDGAREGLELDLIGLAPAEELPDGWTPIDTVLPTGEFVVPVPVDTDPDDVAVLMYTSGTTGSPKGVMISHGNVIAMLQSFLLLTPMGTDSGLLAMAPMFHVAAMSLALAALITGGRVVILRNFDLTHVFDALHTQPITFTFGVPAMLQAMSTEPRFPTTDLSKVLLMCAGAPVPEALLHRYLERGARITQGYGLTESTGVVSLLEPDLSVTKIGSAGMPFPLTAVELRDGDGSTVIDDADTNGEIWIKGRNAVAGYWNRPDETAALRDADGWLRTGDVGRFDVDGFLYITDRAKDMVISGGENVYPAEVEKVLAGHPAIAEVAVIGTPDEQWGELVTAIVVTTEGSTLDLDDLQSYARQHLGGYKIPRRLETVEILPRNASGKVLKRNLREQLG